MTRKPGATPQSVPSCQGALPPARRKTKRGAVSRKQFDSTSRPPTSSYRRRRNWSRSRLGERGTPRLTADQVVSILRRHGFVLSGSTGSHQKWRNVSTAKQVIVSYHRGESCRWAQREQLSKGVESTRRIGRSNGRSGAIRTAEPLRPRQVPALGRSALFSTACVSRRWYRPVETC